MIALGRIGFQFEAEIDLAEEQPRTPVARDQIGVLALPADPGAHRERLFHHRRGIDKDLEVAVAVLGDAARQRFEP